jgi:heptosyltransferase-2
MESENVPYAPTAVKRLVILAPNWLGDAVMSLPAVADVARAAAGVSVDVAARPPVAPLFRMVDGIREVVVLERRHPVLRDFASDLRDRAYDAALLLPNSFQSALTAWRAGIGRRWGFRTHGRGPLLTTGVAPPHGVHQAAYYQELTRALGFESGPLVPRLDVPESVSRAGAETLRAGGWNGRSPLVAIAPGAAYGSAKRWPAESFAELIGRLAGEGIGSVLVGGTGDDAVGREILKVGSGRFFGPAGPKNLPDPIYLVGRTDLPALAGALVHCQGLVSNDSGAMHFGAAIGLRVTALFGPTEEWATRPLGRVAPAVLVHDVWCRPCMLRECPLDHRCMRGITVSAVLAAASAS